MDNFSVSAVLMSLAAMYIISLVVMLSIPGFKTLAQQDY